MPLTANPQDPTPFAFDSITAVLRTTSYLLVVQFATGLLMGFPSSHLPTLQDAVFGDKAFVIVGVFGGVKGLLSLLTGPGIGLFSDSTGRREALALALALSTLPSVWVAIFDLFWGYYVTDAFVGIYSGAISVVMACVADTLQLGDADAVLSVAAAEVNSRTEISQQQEETATSPARRTISQLSTSTVATSQHSSSFAVADELVRRTRAMSIAMAALGLGFMTGTVAGKFLSYANAFRCASLCGIAATCYVWFSLRAFLDGLSMVSRAASAPSEGSGAATNVTVNSGSQHDEQQQQPPPRRTGAALALNFANDEPHSSVTAEQQQQHENNDDQGDEDNNFERDPLSPQAGNGEANASNGRAREYIDTIGQSMHRSHKTLRTYTGLRYLAGIVFCDSLLTQAMALLIPLYLKQNLGFDATDQMWMIVTLGVSGFIGLLVVVPFLTALLQTMGMLRAALVADMICVSLYSVVKSTVLAQLLPLCTVVGIATFPCASSLASEVMFGTTASEGLAQGIVSAARMFAEGVSPLLLGALLSFFQGTSHPGMPFLLVGLLELVALALTGKLADFMNLPSAWRFEEPSASPVRGGGGRQQRVYH